MVEEGSIVDIVAPGFRSTDGELTGALRFIKDLGLIPRISDNLFGEDLLCANNDKIRSRDLKRALLAKDSKMVWCLRAGYGAIRILEDLYKVKKPQNKKLFIGYSDVTLIHHFLNSQWGWPTWHGPVLDRLGSERSPSNEVEELVSLIFGSKTQMDFKSLVPLNAFAKRKKKIVSKIVGGNLAVYQTLLGTPFRKKLKGKILFLEDVGERGYRVDRMLKHFELAGVFKEVDAVLFGTFTGGNEADGSSKVGAVLERFSSSLKIPVFTGLEVGHGSYQRVLPLNSKSVLTCGPRADLQVLV
jgi:muramoyltetrapeptide carboxypeptidase